jgi:DNA-binding transcriptional ArsR family regulator
MAPSLPTSSAPRLSDADFERIAKALADPQRCEILQRTANAGELCCSNIVAACAVSQATISHHLKELATAGLLERRKDGQFAYYSFKREVMAAYLDELGQRMLGGVPGPNAARRKTAARR